MAVSPAQHPFEPWVQLAMADLGRRLRIDIASIALVEARSVVWPDRSLGCARPGVGYPQLQQDGVLIRLQAQGREFAYHGGGAQTPFLCETSAS